MLFNCHLLVLAGADVTHAIVSCDVGQVSAGAKAIVNNLPHVLRLFVLWVCTVGARHWRVVAEWLVALLDFLLSVWSSHLELLNTVESFFLHNIVHSP